MSAVVTREVGGGVGCNCGARGVQAEPGPPSLSVEPCGGSNMHQLFGGSRRDVSSLRHPTSACILCRTTNCTIHHTRAIFAVIMSGYARSTLLSSVPLSRSLSLFFSLVLAFRVRLFGSLGRNLLIAKVQAHQ